MTVTATASLDVDYRKMVSDAAGIATLDQMTQDCLRSVEQLLAEKPALDDALRSRAHRLAGGIGTVGLPALAAALKTLEKACVASPAHDAAPLWASCEALLGDAQAALAADASTRSSR